MKHVGLVFNYVTSPHSLKTPGSDPSWISVTLKVQFSAWPSVGQSQCSASVLRRPQEVTCLHDQERELSPSHLPGPSSGFIVGFWGMPKWQAPKFQPHSVLQVTGIVTWAGGQDLHPPCPHCDHATY